MNYRSLALICVVAFFFSSGMSFKLCGDIQKFVLTWILFTANATKGFLPLIFKTSHKSAHHIKAPLSNQDSKFLSAFNPSTEHLQVSFKDEWRMMVTVLLQTQMESAGLLPDLGSLLH